MRTVLNEFPDSQPGRHFVAACYQAVGLGQAKPTLLEHVRPPHELTPLLREALLAPTKRNVDVVLARTPELETTRAWITDVTLGAPREIVDPVLGPTATLRFRHLVDHNTRAWAMRGGLQAIKPKAVDGEWVCQRCEVPHEVPPQYFNVAPPEQQFSSFTGEEMVRLDSSAGCSWSRLPGGEVKLWVMDGSPAELLMMTLDTVVLDPENFEAILFWRGTFTRPAGTPVPRLVAELVVDPSGLHAVPSLAEQAEEEPPTSMAETPLDYTAALARGPDDPGGAMPFTSSPARSAGLMEPLEPPAESVTSPVIGDEITFEMGLRNTPDTAHEPPGPALPFRASGIAPRPPNAPMQATQPAPIQPAPSQPAPIQPAPIQPAPIQPAGPQPIATWGASAQEPEVEPVTQPTPPTDVGLETIASLDAEMQMGAIFFTSSLKECGLGLTDFVSQRTAWATAIAVESKSGQKDLQSRYDQAMLARIEALRERPISTEDYARVMVAVERLNTDEVLCALGLPTGILLVLTRIFSTRSAEAPALREEIRKHVQAHRR